MASSKNDRRRSRAQGPAKNRPEPRPEPLRPGLVDAVRGVIAPAVEQAGLWLEDVTMTRAGARSVVRVTVDLPETEVGALGSDALGEVSRDISAALDAAEEAGNGIPGVYVLEVSTPGTSRPLTEPRHFRRARTRLVTLTLVDGGEASGRLDDVTEQDGDLVLVLDDGRTVPLGEVRRGRVEVELNRIDEVDLGPESDDQADDADDTDDDAGTSRTQEG